MPPKSSASPKFQPKDMVLAKMTGFPAWPSFVMPSDMISDAIMRAKKKTTNTCVIFIPDGDFNWMNEKSLEILTPEKLKNKISKLPKDKLKPKARKQGARTNNVAEALVAADGLEFDEFMEELAASTSAKNGVEDEDDEDVDEDDQLDVEADDVDMVSVKTPKRLKRSASAISDDDEEEAEEEDGTNNDHDNTSDVEAENGAGTGKGFTNGKSKNATNINSNSASSTKRSRKETPSSTRRRGVASDVENNTALNGDANGKHKVKNGNGSASPKAMSEKDKQHHFWLCRVKLQRSLIQRNQSATPKDPKMFPPPSVDELLMARLILNRLELYPVNVDLLRETKIHKVLKCILKDEDLEFPESFRLHEKCEELLKKWKEPMDQLKNEKQVKSDSRTSKEGDDSTSDIATASAMFGSAPTTANSSTTSEIK